MRVKLRFAGWFVVVLCCIVLCAGARRGPHHPRGSHRHSRPERSAAAVLTQDDEVLHDTKHIEEDTAALTPEQLSKMTPQELEFHYFSAHDFDRNSKLDGLEMLKAVYHTIEHEEDNPEAESSIEPAAAELDGFIALVDRTLATDDTDNDGYVSYAEYRAARQDRDNRRTAAAHAAAHADAGAGAGTDAVGAPA
ncbi:Multiple coagulation factor deficiency protein 2 homolog [Eumeta japonica]|uniref:Multiple coagulation factor deficiency protein 2 homolog n=1 Tax=Eumeta variegata TaxID=151549 RepID=A0A4C1YJ17_EUMVA|nr:Multiple coagulation factor deficiency protein 2 homolog [Eumeta japonica]